MARTLNPVAHAVRRDAFLDAAQVLIQTKGYEAFSIQDVLEQVGASKGAFYHYFASKAALLEGVVARMVDGALASVADILEDPAINAVDKLRAFAAGLATFKAARREFLLGLIQVWLSDENAIVRDKFRRSSAVRIRPVITAIVAQGVREGSFHVTDADGAARVFVALLLGLNETATELFLAVQAGTIDLAEVERQFDAFTSALERIFGAQPGAIALGDRAVIQEWYGNADRAVEGPVA
jgi:AcrR family transcriptional regulator